jgi:hypothetical protein
MSKAAARTSSMAALVGAALVGAALVTAKAHNARAPAVLWTSAADRDEYQQPVAKPRKSGQGQVGDVARGRLTSRLTSRRPVASSASTALVGRVGLVS